MPSLHAYVPAAPEHDADWAFAEVRDELSGSNGVEISTTTNPFTKATDLKVVVDGTYHVTVFFESGEKADADLSTILGREVNGFARLRVLAAPDPELEYDFVQIQLLDRFEKLGPVLVYAVDAEQVLTDTLGLTTA